jgi:preprotein translocase subunit SecA
MLNAVLKKIFGDRNTKVLNELWPVVNEINEEYEKLSGLSDDQLKAKTEEFRNRIAEGTREVREELEELKRKITADELSEDKQKLQDSIDKLEEELTELYEEILTGLIPEAFAVVKDTCRRLVGKSWDAAGNKIEWNMIPYDVQLLGGIVLHQGKIAEMATGEGKTLVATMPIYLNALTGRGVHIVTVNDYLAQRDSEWMGEIFKFHGLSVGVILNTMDPQDRQEQYNADITYGTNNEFGFDYLRDNMSISLENCVHRGYNYTIVDEVDSVLIDEARTPLIISGPVGSTEHKFYEMKPKIERLFKKQSALVAQIVTEAEKLLQSDNQDDITKAGIALLRAQRGFPKNRKLVKLLGEPEYKKLHNATELEFLREKGKRMPEIDEEILPKKEE